MKLPLTQVTWLIYSGLLLALLWGAPAEAFDVRAEVDKNPVIADESFTLTITANDDLPRNAFRSDALTRHFIVGATSVDRSTQLINGQMSRQTRWQLTLIARNPGQYEIPSFTIEGRRTSPIVVDVVAPGDSESQRGPVFVTAEVDNQTPYVQQQVRYTVRLHIAQTLESGSISPPEVEHADIQQASNDEDRQDIIDGQRYRVITRTYFITPRRSGPLSIQGSRFDGQIRDNTSRSFATFSRPQTVSALAADIDIDVQAQPQNYQGHWLPSEQVTLNEEWDDSQRLIVGEPISRRITLTAQGVRDEQLPDIEIMLPEGMRYYPERTERDSFSRQGQRFAQAQFRGVIIPARAGTFQLPAIDVQWWDVERQQQRSATIPAREIEVHEPAGGLASPFAQAELGEANNPPPSAMAPMIVAPSKPGYWRTATLIFGCLWLVTLAAALWLWATKHRKARPIAVPEPDGQVPKSSRQPLQALKHACAGSDAQAAHQALQRWLQSRPGAYQSARQLADTLHSQALHDALDGLEHALYAANKEPWRGGPQLWQAIQRLHQQPAKATTDAKLPSLYLN